MRGGKKKDSAVSDKDKLLTNALNSDFSLAGLHNPAMVGVSGASPLGMIPNLGNVFMANTASGALCGLPGVGGNFFMPGAGGAAGFGVSPLDQELRLQQYLATQQQEAYALQQQQQQQQQMALGGSDQSALASELRRRQATEGGGPDMASRILMANSRGPVAGMAPVTTGMPQQGYDTNLLQMLLAQQRQQQQQLFQQQQDVDRSPERS